MDLHLDVGSTVWWNFVPRSVSVSHVSSECALIMTENEEVAISVRGAFVKGDFIKAFCYEDRRDKIL